MLAARAIRWDPVGPVRGIVAFFAASLQGLTARQLSHIFCTSTLPELLQMVTHVVGFWWVSGVSEALFESW